MAETYCGYRMISQPKTYLGTDYCKVDVTTDTPNGIKYVYAVHGELTFMTTEGAVKMYIREEYRKKQCTKCSNANGCEEKFRFIHCSDDKNNFQIAGLLRGVYEGAGIEKGFVYEIDDLKPAMRRPYLQSVDECKKYIDYHVNGSQQCSLSDYGGV